MAVPPTVAELAAWLDIPTTPPLSVEKTAQLQLCIDTAIDDLDDRCWLPSPWPTKVKTACLMQAARYHKRKGSPEGVAGFGEFGAIRVRSFDPDVEALIGRYLKVEFA